MLLFLLTPSLLVAFLLCVCMRVCVCVCVTSTRQTWEKPSLTCTNKWNVLQEIRRHSIIVTVCTIPDAYHAVPQAPLGHSDHAMVYLIPTYMQKLKSDKRHRKTVKKWTQEAVSFLWTGTFWLHCLGHAQWVLCWPRWVCRRPYMSVSVQTPASPQRLSQSMQMTNPGSQRTPNTNSLQE